MIVNFKKTSSGNYFGYYKGFFISSFKRPHGGWSCRISINEEFIWTEGYFGTSLRTINDVKRWAKSKIDTQDLIKKIGKK